MSAATFGAPGGLSQAIGDQNVLSQTTTRDAMLPGALQLQQGHISKIPAEIMSLWAHANLYTAEAGKAKESLRQSKLASDAMSKWSQGELAPGQDPVDFMTKGLGSMSMDLMKSGAVEAAEKVVSQYQQMVGHQGKIQENALRAKHQDYLQKLDKIQAAGRFLNSVVDQPSFDRAASDWYDEFKEPAPFANPNNPRWAEPYDEKRVLANQERTLTYAQKLAADNRDDKLAAQEKAFDRRKAIDKVTEDLKIANLNLAKARKERLAAQGGKVSEPSVRQVQDAKDFLIDEDPRLNNLTGNNKKLFDLHAKTVTYAAAKLRAGNPGMDWDIALSKAAGEMRDKLDITESEPTKVLGMNVPGTGGDVTVKLKSGKTSAGTGTKDSPIPVGPGITPQEGKYYRGTDGRIGVVKNGRVELVP